MKVPRVADERSTTARIATTGTGSLHFLRQLRSNLATSGHKHTVQESSFHRFFTIFMQENHRVCS